MKALRIVPALAAAALLAAPAVASAQSAPPWQYQNGGWQNGQWQQNNGQRHRHDRDADDNNGNGRNNNGNGLSGTVSSFQPFNLYLNNGTHVELHQGTVITPTGATPQPGQRVRVAGHWNNDGTFSADSIGLR